MLTRYEPLPLTISISQYQNPMKSKPKHITFDVMLNGRYIHTLHFPLRMADDFVDGDYVVSIETLQKYTETKLYYSRAEVAWCRRALQQISAH